MSRPGHCDVCGTRVDHHRQGFLEHVHDFTCAWDDATRALRAARREGRAPGFTSPVWAGPERVDGCVGTGCLRGRHGPLWYRDHVYEPPPEDVLLERMRERRAARLRRRVAARGTWAYATVYQVWLDPDTTFGDAWDVERVYGDWSTMLTVTRERLGISRFTVPIPDGSDRWTLYSEREDVTVDIWRRVVGILVRP